MIECINENVLKNYAKRFIKPENYIPIAEKFTDVEQSILWQCMNNKVGENFHTVLNQIVNKHSEMCNETLYRGLSRRETAFLMQSIIDGKNPLNFEKVMSFSSNANIAHEFAGKWIYATHCILKIENPNVKVFDFQRAMKSLLILAPDSEFAHRLESDCARLADIDMVSSESEWMFPMETNYKIISHENTEINGVLYSVFNVTIDLLNG